MVSALSRYSQDAQCLELAQKIDSAYYADGWSLSTDFWDCSLGDLNGQGNPLLTRKTTMCTLFSTESTTIENQQNLLLPNH